MHSGEVHVDVHAGPRKIGEARKHGELQILEERSHQGKGDGRDLSSDALMFVD